jgi:TIGR03009 family protein
LDQILQFWEKSTADIERYSCKFRRWQYNSSQNFVDQLSKQTKKDIRQVHVTAAAGEVKYMAPDKGMFKVDTLLSLTGQLGADGQPEYKEFSNAQRDWWLCSGEAVYDYDREKKECTVHQLPPEMQGAAILDSPMPFVFGVKADKLKERYWVRELPSQNPNTFIIEVYPKFQVDAVNYDHVQVFLDNKELLPVGLIKFNTEHRDELGTALVDNREVFQFEGREKNASLLQKFNDAVWRKEFIPFDLKDWKVTTIPYAPPAVQDIRAASNNPIGNPGGNNPGARPPVAPAGGLGPVQPR